MQPRCSTWQGVVRGMAALAVLATWGSGSFADQAAKNDPPKPLTKEIVEAWKKAGAKVGWVRVNEIGHVAFLPEEEGKAGDLPAFWFRGAMKEGIVARLPAPESPFGLEHDVTTLTDAWMKEVARLKNLQVLIFAGLLVTDEGVKELAGLKNLQVVSLGGTQMTNAGLKHLLGLKNLRSLDLGGTRVTDEGVKDLAGLNHLQLLDLRGTPVTAAGVNELRKALPGCKIAR